MNDAQNKRFFFLSQSPCQIKSKLTLTKHLLGWGECNERKDIKVALSINLVLRCLFPNANDHSPFNMSNRNKFHTVRNCYVRGLYYRRNGKK